MEVTSLSVGVDEKPGTSPRLGQVHRRKPFYEGSAGPSLPKGADYGATTLTLNSTEVASPVFGVPFT